MSPATLWTLLTLDDQGRLDRLRRYVRGLWGRGDINNPYFTLHGPEHLEQVEMYAEHILAPEHREHHEMLNIVTQEQLFLLLASVWLHDVGMIVPATSEEMRRAREHCLSDSEWIRADHHVRSRDYIASHAAELGLSDIEAGLIGVVSMAHRKENLLELTRSYPNLQLLAAILRASDELDVTCARTPPQLMELLWSDMDTLARWHWVKHLCVACAEPYHYEAKRQSALVLTYQYVLRLPAPRFLVPFWEYVLRPLRRVLDTEGVNSILLQSRIGIGWAWFEHCEQFRNDVLPDGTTVESVLLSILVPQEQLPDSVAEQLARWRMGDAVGASLLRKQMLRLVAECAACPSIQPAIVQAVSDYLGTLMGAISTEQTRQASQEFDAHARRAMQESACPDGGHAHIEKEWRRLGDLACRLRDLVVGDEVAQRMNLAHLLYQLGSDGNDLAASTVRDGQMSGSIRALAVQALGRTGSQEWYREVLDATRDRDPGVRSAAAGVLGSSCGPGGMQRLIEIMDRDVDGDVRRAAEAAAAEALQGRSRSHGEYEGCRVLIVYDQPLVVPPLVDMLERRGVKVRVTPTIASIDWEVEGSVADAVMVDLAGIEPTLQAYEVDLGRLPGLPAARLLREKLGPETPIIVTGPWDSSAVSDALTDIGAIYVQLPTTLAHLVRTVEAVLPPGGCR